MSDRRLLVLDTETTGLTELDIVVEIAWWDSGNGEHGSFIPRHDVARVLEHAHPDALEINSYRERLAEAVQDDGTELRRLHHALRGQSLIVHRGTDPAARPVWRHGRSWQLPTPDGWVPSSPPVDVPSPNGPTPLTERSAV